MLSGLTCNVHVFLRAGEGFDGYVFWDLCSFSEMQQPKATLLYRKRIKKPLFCVTVHAAAALTVVPGLFSTHTHVCVRLSTDLSHIFELVESAFYISAMLRKYSHFSRSKTKETVLESEFIRPHNRIGERALRNIPLSASHGVIQRS